ncbi:three-helix bundle dimerization domain-containing protein [Microbacterium sp. P07]|uniref:three-helix bundle dimerization domain-containing protein n=1 Tax=Microbacterium sp. P07 TaxID=3366952 RepID=UPI0037472F1D
MRREIAPSESVFQDSAARVARHFPHLARARIDAMMRTQYAAFAGLPIQMYVANLVEHDTRSRLARESRDAAGDIARPVGDGPR